MIKKKYLLSPGPTPIPQDVLLAAAQPIIHHRTPEFSDIYQNISETLRYIFQTKQEVYPIASSGSGGMEAAVVNLLCPGDKVITINGGKFGARWGHLCRAYQAQVNEITLEWGDSFPKEQLSKEIEKNPDTKAVFTTLCETSTGTVSDIQGYGEILTNRDAIFVVDGISALGAIPCPMDEWNIDVLIGGSQKLFMTPPGLSYISFNQKAWELVERSTLPKFYFDAKKYRDSHLKKTTPFTPAISLMIQQKKALDFIKDIGLKNLFEHHQILGDATRAGIQALGLELLSKSPGNILTAVKVPEGLDGIKLMEIIHNKYNVYIAGGQDPYKGKIFRIAHVGYICGFEIITALSALEMALNDLGYQFEMGSSIKASEAILKENWK